MTTRSYSPGDWKISAFGIPAVGIKDGTFLKVTENNPGAKMSAGAGGDVVIVQMMDRTGKAEVTLQRESPTNAAWSAIYQAWRVARTAAERALAIGPFHAENINSASLGGGTNCVIEKAPDMEGASDNSACVWTFLIDDVTIFNGGAVI